MDDHGVTRLEPHVLTGERLLEIFDRDLVAVGEHGHTLECGYVDENAARHERTDVLDPEPRKAGASHDFILVEAVVHALTDRLVTEAVELRPDLAHLRDDQLLVRAPAVRLGVHVRRLHVHVVVPASEGHVGVQFEGELDYLARVDQAGCTEHGLRTHVIAGTSLVRAPPTGGASLGVDGWSPGLGVGGGGKDDERGHDDAREAHGPLPWDVGGDRVGDYSPVHAPPASFSI